MSGTDTKVVEAKEVEGGNGVADKAHSNGHDDDGKETKKDESSMINFDLFKFCQDNNSIDCYKALQKEDLHDAEILFKIDMGVVEKALDIKVEGKKVLFMQKLKEMREKFEKEGEIFYMDQGLLETDDDDSDSSSLKLKTAKSHFQFERNEILA